MKRIIVALAVVAGALAAASPSAALSCAPPEPVDWEERFPRVDQAVIVTIERVEEIADRTLAGSLQINAVVVEILKGTSGSQLEYTVPSLNPWGPHYEPGDRVAVIVEGGQVSDGRQNICGPWFEPEELRRAAEAYGDIEPEEPPTAEPPPAPDEGPPERSPVDPPPAVPGPAPESASFLARLLHFFLLMLRILGRG